MYTISFDLVVVDTAQNHPKGISRATWYRRGKLMPSESLTTGEKS
ncbi:hypothetical protein [Neisseria bergeri]|nr:hypothetical protein [Neisseria bergeri]